MPETLVSVRDLVTHYQETKILDDVDLDVRQGEIVVIIGGSGCGKTTLLKHMCGLLRPTSGEILFQGRDMAQMDEEELSLAQRTFGIAFQSSGLFNSMTVGDNVALPLLEYGQMDRELIDAIVRMKLGMVGLGSAQYLMPSALSGGMRKRAGLARAIALDPPLVYFDEPSAGLDPIMASGLDTLILRLRELLGTTFVIVTHELDSIKTIADRIVMLDRGKVIFTGTLNEVESSENERVRQFFERRADEHIQQRNV
jgi:phospholipid/cholesterol/gamma-HCH transport system ATP-binding protein